MKLHHLHLIALSSAPLLASACAGEAEPRGLELTVAPLELEGIGQACYDLRVTNQANRAGQTVWSKGTPGHQVPAVGTPDTFQVGDPDAICSGRYGNTRGGDITYIGTCDADGQANLKLPRTGTTWTPENPTDDAGERVNSVTLWFDGLYDTAGNYIVPTGEDGWQDPCPNGCTLDVLCEENADNLVEFNFTVMRDAQQGFFDIAVNFEDIFCSAKFDSCIGTKAVRDVPPRRTDFDHDGSDQTADIELTLVPFTSDQTTKRWYVTKVAEKWIAADAVLVDRGEFDARNDVWDVLDPNNGDKELGGDVKLEALPAKLKAKRAQLTANIDRAVAAQPTEANNLLFSPAGDRQHTAVAAVACTAGPDSTSNGTTLVFDVPTVKCLDKNGGKVWFKLDELDDQEEDGQGQAGNGEVDADVGAGLVSGPSQGVAYTLRYGLYYDTEDLECPPIAGTDGRFYYEAAGAKKYFARKTGTNGAWELYLSQDETKVTGEVTQVGAANPPTAFTVGGTTFALANSCNKVFYNLALNLGHLGKQGLQGCAFEWAATAVETGDIGPNGTFLGNGDFNDPNGVYGGLAFLGIYVTGKNDATGAAQTLCSENPLNGKGSYVQSGYVKGTAINGGDAYNVDYSFDGDAVTSLDAVSVP